MPARLTIVASVLAALFALHLAARGDGAPPDKPRVLRFGFLRNIFANVNENDGRAAMKIHTMMLLQSENINVAPEFAVFDDAGQLGAALEAGEVDMVAFSIRDFLRVPPRLLQGPVVAPIANGRTDDEYVLVTREDSNRNTVRDLVGRSALLLEGPRGSMVQDWLDVLFLREGLGVAADNVTLRVVQKPSQALLPVFFGQTDFAVLPRSNLAMMGELNPQLLRQLRVVATSPTITPALMCFRAGLSPVVVQRIISSATRVPGSESGRQLITIFRTSGLVERPMSCLDTARDLLAEHERLTGRPSAASGTPFEAVTQLNQEGAP